MYDLFKNYEDEEILKYSVTWGLVHDIATWPLSHTSEPVFSSIFHISSGKLREMMLVGSEELPRELSLSAAIEQAGMDPGILVQLFSKQGTDASVPEKLLPLKKAISSALNPDTLEGIWRSSKAFPKINVPYPLES